MQIVYFIQSHKNPAQVYRLVDVIKQSSSDSLVLLSHDFSSCSLDSDRLKQYSGVELIKRTKSARRGDKSVLEIYLDNWVYPSLFARLGSSVRIRSRVEFVRPQDIELGDRVTIDRDSYLSSAGTSKAHGGNNRVCLEEGVHLGSGVRLDTFGNDSRIHLKKHAILDRGVDLRSLERGSIEVGEATYIGPYTCLAGPGAISIGKSCLIASHSGIYANNHNFANPNLKIVDQGITCKGIAIEDDCWLGTGVKVLDGVTIGRGCVIGAGAVVTKDLPAYTVAVGVPAKVVSQRLQ